MNHTVGRDTARYTTHTLDRFLVQLHQPPPERGKECRAPYSIVSKKGSQRWKHIAESFSGNVDFIFWCGVGNSPGLLGAEKSVQKGPRMPDLMRPTRGIHGEICHWSRRASLSISARRDRACGCLHIHADESTDEMLPATRQQKTWRS